MRGWQVTHDLDSLLCMLKVFVVQAVHEKIKRVFTKERFISVEWNLYRRASREKNMENELAEAQTGENDER